MTIPLQLQANNTSDAGVVFNCQNLAAHLSCRGDGLSIGHAALIPVDKGFSITRNSTMADCRISGDCSPAFIRGRCQLFFLFKRSAAKAPMVLRSPASPGGPGSRPIPGL